MVERTSWIERAIKSAHVVALIGCLALVASCGSGGGSSSSTPPPEPLIPITATMQVSSTQLREGSLDVETVIFDLSAPVRRTVSISLSFMGTAQLGVDYEIDQSILRFRPNQTRITLDLSPIDDWEKEEVETFTISMSGFSSAVTAGAVSSLAFTLEDDGDGEETFEDKDGRPDLYLFLDLGIEESEVVARVSILNIGTQDAGSSFMNTSLSRYIGDGRTGEVIENASQDVPGVEGNYGRFAVDYSYPLDQLRPGETYWVFAAVDPPSDDEFFGRLPNSDTIGFTVTNEGDVLTDCNKPDRPTPPQTSGDPLLEHQWGIRNMGQSAFSSQRGLAGEDLRMFQTLADAMPTGKGVKVAVVDTGLEICHPDLVANVVEGGSFNFKAVADDLPWVNINPSDPFLPVPLGDHGTAVAGVISATADNGLGLRGVSPDVQLYGYNFLTEQCCREDALGMSSSDPASDQIDVFNMSFGTLGHQGNAPDDSVFLYGTSNLRDGKGAIYVKSAGNSFNACYNLDHFIHREIGCTESNGDSRNNVPHAIVVGAVNAHGDKASYASVGSNLWISGPAGEYGYSFPATITTDQAGADSGYDARLKPGLAAEKTLNPHGDYISTFNGTSASAPHISGVAALLLEVEPELTWRDVKHILAATARKPRVPNVPDIRVAIGGEVTYLRRDWITNAAGYDFHNWFGFGIADVDSAVAMARGYAADSLGTQTRTNWITEPSIGRTIPDYNGAGITSQIEMSSGIGSSIEAVQINVSVSHPKPTDLGIELTSPSGTTSILNSVFNNALAYSDSLEWNLVSNAFYGESPNGTWHIRIFDAAPSDEGFINSWGLRMWLGNHPN